MENRIIRHVYVSKSWLRTSYTLSLAMLDKGDPLPNTSIVLYHYQYNQDIFQICIKYSRLKD